VPSVAKADGTYGHRANVLDLDRKCERPPLPKNTELLLTSLAPCCRSIVCGAGIPLSRFEASQRGNRASGGFRAKNQSTPFQRYFRPFASWSNPRPFSKCLVACCLGKRAMAAERQYLRLGSSPSRLPVRSVQYASVADLSVRKYRLAVVQDRGCAIQTEQAETARIAAPRVGALPPRWCGRSVVSVQRSAADAPW